MTDSSTAPRRLALIAALDENGTIGRDGALPWHLPKDLRYFKRLTLGGLVLMGRGTWDSLGRPLPQRENWVLTHDASFSAPGARVFHALEAALDAAGDRPVMVIGGAQIYRQTLPLASVLYLTEVHAHLPGDARFPDFDRSQWREAAREDHPADERHAYPFSFLRLERR